MSEATRKAADASVILLAVLATLAVLSLGRPVFVPLALSVVLAAALFPLVRRLERLRVPTTAGAVIVVIGALVVVGLVGLALEEPIRDLAAEVPKSIATARPKVDAIRARMAGLMGSGRPAPRPAADSARAGQQDSVARRRGPRGGAPSSPPSTAAADGAATRALGITTSLLAEAVEEILLVFFLLAAGRGWMDKLARMAHSPTGSRRWPEIAGEMRDVVGRYLYVTLLINIGQAIVIGLAAWAVGMPTPPLWAMLTFVAEWVPYLGGLTMIALLLVAGLADSGSVAHALLMPGIYLVVTTLQNNLVSPIAYGRGLRLNPTSILVAVMLFFFMWGVAGAFLAVPIFAALRVLASRVPALEPLNIALEE
jgi:predicted PurR-regulated permease PerM